LPEKYIFKNFSTIFKVSARLHSLTKLWFQRWLVGLWQCVQCGSAIVLKNVWWAKNKKHRVGLSVGSLVFSIFLFSVLSQWFIFQFSVCRFCFLHLAVTVACMSSGGLRVAFLSRYDELDAR